MNFQCFLFSSLLFLQISSCICNRLMGKGENYSVLSLQGERYRILCRGSIPWRERQHAILIFQRLKQDDFDTVQVNLVVRRLVVELQSFH